jgi:hypothetical protein
MADLPTLHTFWIRQNVSVELVPEPSSSLCISVSLQKHYTELHREYDFFERAMGL